MRSESAPQGARDQLAALASSWDEGSILSLPPVDDPRPAAVLILFGVLDSRSSERLPGTAAVPSDLDVLLLARAANLRSHPGQIAFPGGQVDPSDRDAVSAALREAEEETGLDPGGVEVLGALGAVPLAYSRHLVTPVLAWWQHPSAVRAMDAAESADVFRVAVADLLDPARRGSTVIRRDGQEWRSPGFLVPHPEGDYLVWGFTAMLLDGLFDRLGWTEPWDQDRVLPLRF